jgi:hypothetical protein
MSKFLQGLSVDSPTDRPIKRRAAIVAGFSEFTSGPDGKVNPL